MIKVEDLSVFMVPILTPLVRVAHGQLDKKSGILLFLVP